MGRAAPPLVPPPVPPPAPAAVDLGAAHARRALAALHVADPVTNPDSLSDEDVSRVFKTTLEVGEPPRGRAELNSL